MPQIRLSRFLPAILLLTAVFVALKQSSLGSPLKRASSSLSNLLVVQDYDGGDSQAVFDEESGELEPRYTRRIVAVGDLHGDYLNTLRVLRMADVVDEEGNWSGNVDLFVQTGDIIDRYACHSRFCAF